MLEQEKVARASSCNINVEKTIGFVGVGQRARDEIWTFFFEKPLGFCCFYVEIVTKPKVLVGFRLARANVHFTSFFVRDS